MKRLETFKIRYLPVLVLLLAVGLIGFSRFTSLSRAKNQLNSYQIEKVKANLNIITSTPAASSNPHDYIKAHKNEYEEIVQMGSPIVDYFIEEFKKGNLSGSKEWITAWICNRILGDKNPIKIWDEDNNDGWSTGRDWYEKYIKIKTDGEGKITRSKDEEMQQFKTALGQYMKQQNLEEALMKPDEFHDITPEAIYKEDGCLIFKNGETCESFLFYEGKVYPLGIGFGGLGLVDIATCDFDRNGANELFYSFSFGSGLHRSEIGCFDLSAKTNALLDLTLSVPAGYVKDDLVFEKTSDTEIQVYTASVRVNSGDFTDLTPQKEKLFGVIKEVEGKPTFFIN